MFPGRNGGLGPDVRQGTTKNVVLQSSVVPADALLGKTRGKERSGNIEEASSLFGKDFDYQWDYAAVRTALQQVAAAAGYGWETVLNPKSV